MSGKKMTHSSLIKRAERWCRKSKRCPIVLTEFVSSAYEVPDVIAWIRGASILIECKATRADFLSDFRSKPHRRNSNSMGRERFYFVPAGLVDAGEVPKGWGLIFCHGRQVRIVKNAQPRPDTEYRVAEYPLLLSIARRVELRGLMSEIRDATTISINPESPRLIEHDTEEE